MAPNLALTPALTEGVERWCANAPRSYRIKWAPALDTWTRWFNMHTKRHILLTYPKGYEWYTQQSKPIYLQEKQADIPSSIAFPRAEIQDYFGDSGHYFAGSISWFVAFAIMEGFERIELYGFELKRDRQYDFERPCLSYWVNEARERGIEIFVPPDLDGVPVDFGPPGDPSTYSGPLYGYEPHSDAYKRTF